MLLALLLGAPLPVHGQADVWPQFRGPDAQGHSMAVDVPLTWSETENIRWKTAIPGIGWSSPAVGGNQVWLTTSLDEGHVLRAIAVDRTTGEIRQDVEIFKLDVPGPIHPNNSHASPSPLLDGDRVYVHFGGHGTACLSDAGKILWKTQDLKYNHEHGPGGSPVLWNDLLIFSCDGSDQQFVVALDKQTGQIRWKRDRAHITEERKTGAKAVPMAYCTPLLVAINGRTQLISQGSDAIVGYDPATGEELWHYRYSGYSNVPRPVLAHGLLFFATGFDGNEVHAIRVDGQGDLTETHLAWKNSKRSTVPMNVSPIVVGDEVYTISDNGIALCLDAHTGKQHWQQRLSGKFWASPVFAQGRLYCLNDTGKMVVLAPGVTFEQLAENQLDGNTQATPAFVDGAIFLRTETHLYRIGK